MLTWRALTVCAIIAVDVCKRYKRYTSRIQTLVKMFKVNFIYEEYLDSVPHNLRCLITRLRISAHSLRIHTGRFGVNRLPRHERLCLHCNLQDVEDVYHFVCICPKYRTIRLKYTINRYYYFRPSMYKFYELLRSNDNNICTILHVTQKKLFQFEKILSCCICHC